VVRHIVNDVDSFRLARYARFLSVKNADSYTM